LSREEEQPLLGFMTRNYLVLTLTSTLWGIPVSIINTYFSLYIQQLGGTETVIGLIAALGSATFVAFAILGGHIADVYGRKRLVGTMTVFVGFSYFLMAIAPNWQFLAIATVVVNVFWIFEPAFWAMLADSIKKEKRGTAFAVFSCLSLLPWAIMPSIGGYLIDLYDVLSTMRVTFVCLAIVGITIGLLRLLLLTETITPQDALDKNEYSVRGLGKFVKDAFKGHLQTWLWMPPSALALTACYILWAFEYGLVEPYWVIYAKEMIGLTSTEWGIAIGVGSAIGLGSKILVVGKLLDKFGRRKILLVTTGLDIFTYLLFIRSGMFTHVLALWIVGSFIWSFYEPAYSSLEADIIPERRRGRVFAAFGVAWSAFSIPASLIGGLVYEQISPQLSFVMAAICIGICFIFTLRYIRQSDDTSARDSRLSVQRET